MQYRIQAIVVQLHLQAFYHLCRSHFHFLGSITVCYIRLPCLVPMGRCGGMVVIIHVKLHSVRRKRPGILHHVFHAVHDHLRPHWNKRIGGVHCDRMACCRIHAAGRRPARPWAAADRAAAIAACDYLPQRFSDTDGLGFCHHIPHFIYKKAVLFLEDFLYLVRHLAECKLPVLCRKIRNQMVGVM